MSPSPRRRTLLGASVLPVALSLMGCGTEGGPDGPGEEPRSDGGGAAAASRPVSPDRCLPAGDAVKGSSTDPSDAGQEGTDISPLPDHHLSEFGLALFGDGSRIAANQTADAKMLGESDTSGTVVWSTADGSILEALDNGLVGAVSADQHDRLALAGVANVEIRTDSGELTQVLTGGEEPPGPRLPALISELAFTSDGSRLVVLGADGRLTVWHIDGDTCESENELATDLTSVTAISLSPVDDTLAVCGVGGPVELWDPIAGTRTGEAPDLPGTAAGLTHAHDGTLIICTDAERAVHALSPSGELTTGPELTASGPYWAAAAPDGRVAVVARGDNRVLLWSRESGGSTQLPVLPGTVGRLVWSPDGGTLYSASPAQGVVAWSGQDDWRRFETP